MKFNFKKNNVFAVFALCAAFVLASCTNEVDASASGGTLVGESYAFPEAAGISRCFYSQVYNKAGNKCFTVPTFNLQGWEDIPFLRLADVAKFINFINNRGWKIYFPDDNSQDGLYSYKYFPADAGRFYPVEWKDDTLYFDVKNQTIYSDNFTRLITSSACVNNGIGTVYAWSIDTASKSFPKVVLGNNNPSNQTAYVEQKQTTTINLKDYGLKMFVFDTTPYNSNSFDGYENDLLIPFQVIADTFLRCAVCSFNGYDYYAYIDATSDDLATVKAYDSGRVPRSTRSQLKAEYNYRNLCLLFDRNYCLKERRAEVNKDNIGAFINDSIFNAGLGFDLLSTDTATYDAALVRFLKGYIDDGHTGYHEPSMYQSYASISQYKAVSKSSSGIRNKTLDDVYLQRMTARKAAGGKQGVFYVTEGGEDKLAVVVFDNFLSADPGDLTDFEEIANKNTYWFFENAFADIARHPTVQNVVIDLSCNGGGVIAQCMVSLCYLSETKDLYMAEKNHLDNSLAKFTYQIQDLNGNTSLKKNYNFYVLTSGFSFSCGNFFPAVCHYQLGIPVIGQRSGGGGGVVKPTQTSDGALFQTSASAEMCALDNGKYVCIDAGVPVDHAIDYDKFYSGSVIYGDLYGMLKGWYPDNF